MTARSAWIVAYRLARAYRHGGLPMLGRRDGASSPVTSWTIGATPAPVWDARASKWARCAPAQHPWAAELRVAAARPDLYARADGLVRTRRPASLAVLTIGTTSAGLPRAAGSRRHRVAKHLAAFRAGLVAPALP